MPAYKYVNTDDSGMGTYSDTPGTKSRVVGGTQSKAGAGRGEQGGPTAAQARQNRGTMSDAEKAAREELDFKKMSEYREDQKYAKGGKTASARADGIAQRGKTKGTIVACGGGYMKGKK